MAGSGYNPSAIAIKRQLGATRPIRPPQLPHANATPKIGSPLNLRSMMRPGFDDGGMPQPGGKIVDHPSQPFTGGIMSMGGGRTDDVPMHVPNGAYVMPAWSVSHLGEGNTLSGMQMLKGMFGEPWSAGKAPYGAPQPKGGAGGQGIKIPKPPPAHVQIPVMGPPGYSDKNPALAQAHGGAAVSSDGPIPINASGGEFVITPEAVAKEGDGNLDKGHMVLDKWVLALKKEAAETLRKLPGPAK